MTFTKTVLTLALALGSTLTLAQEAAQPPQAAASAYVPKPWVYKTPKLNKAQVDALLAKPEKLLILDVRRPDEIAKWGGFQAYLNVQLEDLPHAVAFIPRDRVILPVSIRANRGGDAGDLLTALGFKVAGATGTEDYREAGGKIYKVEPPAAKPAN
ncbi:MAG TPA: rhodanese-like domain-containing protein [Aquabacterium sp.]|nr:rhodanese-like domain-containing protein [Aquabacterium sp.]